MAKKSAKDELIARIEADLARVNAVVAYLGQTMTEAQHELIDTDVARLQGMLNYVAAAVSTPAGADTPKPKRGRGKGKKGLPAAPAGDDESTRMAV